MDKKAIQSLGKIALGKLHDATERASKGDPIDPFALEALSLISALCEAITRDAPTTEE